MKSNYLQALLLLFACFTFYEASSQTIYANREWVEETPVTSSAYQHTSTIVSSGNLIVTGNVLNGSGDTDIITVKYDSQGDTVWYKTFAGNANDDDYGIDLIENSSGDIVVIGAVKTSAGDYDYVVISYDGADGTEDWNYIWDGDGNGVDIPSDVALDASDNIFVTGGSEASNGLSDYGTIKLTSGGSFTWESFYDYNDLHDGATSIIVAGTRVIISGGSAATAGDWDIATVRVNINTGAFIVEVRTGVSGATIEDVRAMTTDSDNNLYLTGYAVVSGENNIQTIKMDSTLTVEWITGYDGGDDDEGYDIGLDNSGNVYITGFTERSSGKFQGVTIKYSDLGDTLWTRLFGNIVSEDGMKARKLAVEPNGDSYITGSTYGGGQYSFAFVKYNSSGEIELSKTYQADSLDDNGFDIVVDGEDVFLTGFTETVGGTRMTSIKYSLKEKDMSLTYDGTTGKPIRAKNDLIIRVDTSLINHAEINQLQNDFWTLDQIFDASFVTDIERALEDICEDESCDINIYRVFRNMTTYDTLSISRSGDTIRIPPFWSTFIFEFPDGVDLQDASDTLVQMFPDIKYSTYNLVGYLDDVPDDPDYDNGQISLHTDPSPSWPDVHINVEPAWDIEYGQRFIKVGVLDGPMQWEHEDFGGEFSTKVDGWDFYLNQSIYTVTPAWSADHGTACAGIIGAIRFNDMGIAGIAGGSYENGEDLDSSGVSLYGMRILGHPDSLILMNHIADAVYGSSVEVLGSDYGWGLHITNNSYGISNAPYFGGTNPWFLDTNITLLRESYHFANRNEVVVVASRGNSGLIQDGGTYHYNYPGVLDDDWIICVGGLGNDGDYHDGVGSFEYGWKASRGPEIDVSSFSAGSHNWTTQDSSEYNTFNGTSAAAPHVAGVAALMLSYLNVDGYSYDNLAPEDVEWVLQHTAQDRNTGTHPGYDTLTGYGIVRAGEAFEILEKPKYELKHFGTDAFPNSTTFSLYSTQDTVTLTERFENEVGTWFLGGVPYVVDVYKVTSFSGHIINSNDSIIGAWPRPSSSNVFALYDGSNVLQPRERVSLDSLDNTYGYLHGFIYYVEDTLGNPLGWWPIDTLTDFNLTYSILKTDTTVFLENEELISNVSVNVYPNPTGNNQMLELNLDQPMDGNIRLYDMNGRVIMNVYSGHFNEGQTNIKVDVNSLPAGIYMYSILFTDETSMQIKVIIQ